jgi:hypothetical protein
MRLLDYSFTALPVKDVQFFCRLSKELRLLHFAPSKTSVILSERNVAIQLEADEELPVVKWAEQLKVGNNRTMTFVDKSLLNCSSSPLYISLSRNTRRAFHALEFEMNLNNIYKSHCKYKNSV